MESNTPPRSDSASPPPAAPLMPAPQMTACRVGAESASQVRSCPASPCWRRSWPMQGHALEPPPPGASTQQKPPFQGLQRGPPPLPSTPKRLRSKRRNGCRGRGITVIILGARGAWGCLQREAKSYAAQSSLHPPGAPPSEPASCLDRFTQCCPLHSPEGEPVLWFSG